MIQFIKLIPSAEYAAERRQQRLLFTALITIPLLFGMMTVSAQENFAEWVELVETQGHANNNVNNVITDGEYLYLNGTYTGAGTLLGEDLPEYQAGNGFIAKIDLAGNPVWISTMGGSGIDSFFDIELDSQGNVVATGWSTSTDDVEVNEQVVIAGDGMTTTKGIVARFSGTDGSLDWINHWASAVFSSANPGRLTVDDQDNVYVNGYYGANFEVDGVEFTFSNDFGHGLFMLRLDSAGNASWGQSLEAEESGGFITLGAVEATPAGVYFAFGYSRPFVVNGNPLPHQGDFYWLAITQVDPDTGTIEDYTAFGSETGGQGFTDLRSDSENNLIAAGFFSANTNFEIGNTPLSGYGQDDGFVAKFDSGLELLWARDMGGALLDRAFNVFVTGDDAVHIGGGFDSSVNFEYDGMEIIDSRDPGSLAMFQIHVDHNGNFNEALALHGEDQGTTLSNNRSVVLQDGTVYSAGRFIGGVHFNESEYHFSDHETGFIMQWEDKLGETPEPQAVLIEILGEVWGNQIGAPPLGDVQPEESARITFAVNSADFEDNPQFPTRGYFIDLDSFELSFSGGVSIGLTPTFDGPAYFVVRDNDPAVDGFFISEGTGFPSALPLDQEGGIGDYFGMNFNVSYDNDPLGSLDILDAVGTYDFTGLIVFGMRISDGFVEEVLGMNFESLTISVDESEPGLLEVNPQSLDFGGVEIGQTSSSTVTVSNAGGTDADPLEVESVDLSGQGFSISDNGCPAGTVLEPFQSCNIEITFSSDVLGGFNGELTVEVGDGTVDGQSAVVPLSGSGVGPPVTIPELLSPANGAVDVELQPEFTWQGVDICPGEFISLNIPMGMPGWISPDGNTVVGSYFAGGGWVWNAETGLVNLSGSESAVGMARDGFPVAGSARNPDADNRLEVAIWTSADAQPQFLGGLPGGLPLDGLLSNAYGISGDGGTVVGLAYGDGSTGGGSANAYAFAWTEAGGMVALSKLTTERAARANGINHDGSIIWGWNDEPTGFRRAVRWENGVIEELQNDAGGSIGEAGGATRDGSVIIGGSLMNLDTFQIDDAWRWTAATGAVSLGNLVDWQGTNWAFGTSDDGNVIIGATGFGPNRDATIWTAESNELRWMVQALDDMGIDVPAAWHLNTGTAVSADGSVFVGWGADGTSINSFMVRLGTDNPDYQIQIATDAGFGDIVIDETVAATSFVSMDELEAGTEYFWRVRAAGAACGESEWSSVFSFTTAGGAQNPGVLQVEPEALDFGDVVIGRTSTGMVTVSNAGDADDGVLELESVTLTGSGFSISENGCPAGTILEPFWTCHIEVSFSPDMLGGFNGELTVMVDDGTMAGQSAVISLAGNGVEPPVTIPELLSPANGAVDVALQPEFSWQGADICPGEFVDLGISDGTANWISLDGNSIVGSYLGGGGWVWNAETGLVNLPGSLNGVALAGNDFPAVGNAHNPNEGNRLEAAIWTSADAQPQFLGGLPGGLPLDNVLSTAFGISADGGTVVGLAYGDGSSGGGNANAFAFVWTEDDGMVALPKLNTNRAARANGVSDDGSIVWGWNDLEDGFRRAVRWESGMIEELQNSAGGPIGEAGGATRDGTVIVGGNLTNLDTGQISDAWRWTAETGAVSIGDLVDFFGSNWAFGTSSDGNVIIGATGFGAARDATIWTAESNELRWMVQALDDMSIDVPAEWHLNTGTAVSADGTIIAGWGADGTSVNSFMVRLGTDDPEYQIQVATDAGFGDIVIDETVAATSFVPMDELEAGTEYFWRVRATGDGCGEGEWSEAFSFTTAEEVLIPGVLQVDPEALDFGSVVVGSSGIAQVTISNAAAVGAADLTLTQIEVTAGDPEFAIAGDDCGVTLAAQESCTVEVQFAPAAEQAYSGILRVDAKDNSAINVALSGAGVEPVDPGNEIFSDRFEE